MQQLSEVHQVNPYQKNVKTEVIDFVITNNFVMQNWKLICQQFKYFEKYKFPPNKQKVTK